jgi:hypothetical protein
MVKYIHANRKQAASRSSLAMQANAFQGNSRRGRSRTGGLQAPRLIIPVHYIAIGPSTKKKLHPLFWEDYLNLNEAHAPGQQKIKQGPFGQCVIKTTKATCTSTTKNLKTERPLTD